MGKFQGVIKPTTQRLAHGEKQIARQIVGQGLPAQGVAQSAEKAENVDRALHFPGALRQRLSFFAREQFRQLRLARLEDL